MASHTGFLDELSRYRPPVLRYHKIVARLKECPNIENIWSGILGAAKRHGKAPPDAARFIEIVVSSTLPTKQLIDHDAIARTKFKKLKAEIVRTVKDAIHPSDLLHLDQAFGPQIRTLHSSSYDFNSMPISRKDQDGSRNRIAFTRRVQNYLAQACGEPRNDDVSLLIDVVFNRSGSDARVARRKTTTAGRQKKR
jgi:hypothetical protein